MIRIFSYAQCSSCRTAETLLRSLGVSVERRDIFKEPLSVAEIKALFAETGLGPLDVLSTRSRPYAALGLAGRELSGEEIVELMSQHPALIRRPIVVKDGHAVIGLNQSAITKLAST